MDEKKNVALNESFLHWFKTFSKPFNYEQIEPIFTESTKYFFLYWTLCGILSNEDGQVKLLLKRLLPQLVYWLYVFFLFLRTKFFLTYWNRKRKICNIWETVWPKWRKLGVCGKVKTTTICQLNFIKLFRKKEFLNGFQLSWWLVVAVVTRIYLLSDEQIENDDIQLANVLLCFQWHVNWFY